MSDARDVGDDVRGFLVRYRDAHVNRTWPMVDVNVTFEGATIVLRDAGENAGVDARILASGTMSAPRTLAADFWAAAARVDAPLASGPLRLFSSHLDVTAGDAFLVVGEHLLEAGHVDEAVMTWLFTDTDRADVRKVVQRHSGAVGAENVALLFSEPRGSMTFEQAVRASEGGLSAASAPERAKAAHALADMVSHFLSTRKPATVFKRFGALIDRAVADPVAAVREHGWCALGHVADVAWAHGARSLLRASVPRLVEQGVDLRENLARAFELALVDGNRDDADAIWSRVAALSALSAPPRARHLFERPTWDDRRVIALTEAGWTLLLDERDVQSQGRARGAALLAEALASVAETLVRDLEAADKGAGRGFLVRTLEGNARAAEQCGDRALAHSLYTRARNAYRVLVTTTRSTASLDDAITRTAPGASPGLEREGAAALIAALLQADAIVLSTDKPTSSLLEAVTNVLANRPDAATLSSSLVAHPDVEALFADDDDLERLIAQIL